MLKEERHKFIIDLISEKGIIKVNDIQNALNVTDMTIRRDLKELEDKNMLDRVHGGAIKKNYSMPKELTHQEKRTINVEQKKHIASLIAKEINEDEIVFLGAGTTIEFVYDYMNVNRAKIITNSILVFEKFKNDPRYELILIGGVYRESAAAFIGVLANQLIENIFVQKAFISVNGLDNNYIYNANEEEGKLQRTMIENSKLNYIVLDSTKFNKQDFYRFSNINDIDFLITDNGLPQKIYDNYAKKIKILK